MERWTTFLVCCLLLSLRVRVQSELIIQRMSGTTPDRFTENEGCTKTTCSEMYGAEPLVPDSCQCRCTLSRPTFSIQHMTCVLDLQDCNNLTLIETSDNETDSIFAVLVSESLQIVPTLPVNEKASGLRLAEVLNCAAPKVKSVEYDALGGYAPLAPPSLIAETHADTNFTYLKFVELLVKPPNTSREDVSGLLLKVRFHCNSEQASKLACLPLKIHGFQKVGSWRTTIGEVSATSQMLKPLKLQVPYIVGGTVLGVIVVVVLIAAMIIACATPPKIAADRMRVRRVEKHWSINSSRKNPIRRIFRGISLGDFRERRSAPAMRPQTLEKLPVTAISTTSVDSGRGGSRSPSTLTKATDYDKKALAEAVLVYESRNSHSLKEVHHQPRLFKSHQDKLSTARQGISSVPTATHKQNSSEAKKLSPLKRFFSRKSKKSPSEMSDSRLSIDYDHFHITEAPPPQPQLTGKRFSESHVNPDIRFSDEGKLAQTEEVQIEVPVSWVGSGTLNADFTGVENDLYEGDSNRSFQLTERDDISNLGRESGGELPETCIDDVVEAASEFEDYEHVQSTSNSVHDFFA